MAENQQESRKTDSLKRDIPPSQYREKDKIMSILEVKDLTHGFGDKTLFRNASMILSRGEKMGLTGLNGVGKSTFLGMLTGEIIPDQGLVRWNPRIRMGYLDQQAKINGSQTVRSYLCGAFDQLYEVQDRIDALAGQVSQKTTDPDEMQRLLDEMGQLQSILDSSDFYTIDSDVEKIASGLGIAAFGLDTPVAQLSGGQRAKVLLAKLLLENPDVLLLDEPTNFLDKEHIDWLSKYLSAFKGSFIVVSHDYDFLDRVVNCICDIEFGVMSRYNGSYKSFVAQKAQKHDEYVKAYGAQQKEVARLEDYIRKNITRASTAGMAKSRRKKLEKMDLLEKPAEHVKPTYHFPFVPLVGRTALWVNDLTVGYIGPLLPPINLMLSMGQKLAVTGFNGIGKSTFLKTICGYLPPISGNFKYNDKIITGYYEQEHVWQDPSRTPFDEIREAYPRMTDKEIRGALSRAGLGSDQMTQALSTLSGGEQAKVKLCKLSLRPCNLLVLDEPTNHLDADSVSHLQTVLKAFAGSVIFVSHSKPFCAAVADSELDFEKLFD